VPQPDGFSDPAAHRPLRPAAGPMKLPTLQTLEACEGKPRPEPSRPARHQAALRQGVTRPVPAAQFPGDEPSRLGPLAGVASGNQAAAGGSPRPSRQGEAPLPRSVQPSPDQAPWDQGGDHATTRRPGGRNPAPSRKALFENRSHQHGVKPPKGQEKKKEGRATCAAPWGCRTTRWSLHHGLRSRLRGQGQAGAGAGLRQHLHSRPRLGSPRSRRDEQPELDVRFPARYPPSADRE